MPRRHDARGLGEKKMQQPDGMSFGSSGLERAAEFRNQPAALAEMLARGHVLVLWRGKPLVVADGGLAWVSSDAVVLHHAGAPVFLGLDDDMPCFAADVSDWSPEAGAEAVASGFQSVDHQHHPSLPDSFVFSELREALPRLSAREAELAATAKSLLHWHRSHGFCSACGARSEVVLAGWQRNCPTCGAQHFPRTDPVVIMLITKGEMALVGRNANWAPKMHSCLAGFIEPGETVESAVRREVFEEAGIRVGQVSFLRSQPWPFPASLMLGCSGEALSEEITIDPNELEAARWISREDLLQARLGTHPEVSMPRVGSIARFMLDGWLAGEFS